MSDAPYPDRPAGDDDASWGDPPSEEYDDERLRAERPPHHDRD